MIYYGFKSIAKFPRSNLKNLGFANGMAQVIKSLFANNEQGFAFDFNDLSTMYQDSAGTIPVTGVGQPVGKVLDKSGRGNHAYQTTSSKRPILQKNATTGAYYLAFDGVDDCLITADIDFSANKNISLFASVIFNNTSTQPQFITVLSNDSWVNQGTFGLWRGYSQKMDYALRRRVQSSAEDLTANNSSNTEVVLTGIINSTANVEYIRNRGVTLGSKTLSETSDSFKKYPLYIGAQGESLFLNGNLYSLIGVARIVTTLEITNTENAIAKNIGVTL